MLQQSLLKLKFVLHPLRQIKFAACFCAGSAQLRGFQTLCGCGAPAGWLAGYSGKFQSGKVKSRMEKFLPQVKLSTTAPIVPCPTLHNSIPYNGFHCL